LAKVLAAFFAGLSAAFRDPLRVIGVLHGRLGRVVRGEVSLMKACRLMYGHVRLKSFLLRA